MSGKQNTRTNGRLGVIEMVREEDEGQPALPTLPDPEVLERPTRRQFTTEYKLRIVAEADACGEGEIGALLRREGLYSSHLSNWRRQRERGEFGSSSSRKRGRRAHKRNPLEGQLKESQREVRRLRRRLQRAETVIEVQKKLSDLLGIPLEPQQLDESDDD